jgi:hypothetical protein
LRLSQETQVSDIGGCDFTSDLCAAPSLVDDQLESVFRNGAVGIEEIAQRIIRGIGEITLDFAPPDQARTASSRLSLIKRLARMVALIVRRISSGLSLIFLVFVPSPR